MGRRIHLLDGLKFKQSIIASARRISEMENHLNSINVFPVPDGDTGTNMAVTMDSIAKGAESCDEVSFEEISSAIADSAFVGARGNSGAILAQFFQGLAEATKGKIELTTQSFARAAMRASEQAREAISAPQEGTIITVMKDWAHHLMDRAQNTQDFVDLLSSSLANARDSLADTPNKLKILKKAGVVDAGAQGFVNLLEGMVDFIASGKIAALKISSHMAQRVKGAGSRKSHANTTFRYCTEGLIEGADINRDELRGRLVPLGNSLIVVGSPKKVRFHIHSNEPEKVFAIAGSYGLVADRKIDDMHEQQKRSGVEEALPSIGLVTDSTCDLPADVVRKHNISVVPLLLQVGKESYRDRVDMEAEDFYQLLESSKEKLSTSRPPQSFFVEAYERLVPRCESILSIHISEALSSTAEGARMSCKGTPYKEKIHVIDSGATSMSLGLLVMEAALLIEKGLSIEKILERLEDMKKRLRFFVSIPDISYSVRGGRVSKVKGIVGRILNLKPVISMDMEGKAYHVAYTFGRKRVMKKVLELACAFASEVENPRFNIGHVSAPHIAKHYRDEICSRFGVEDVMINVASPVIGVHVGIGSSAIAVMGDAGC